MSYATTTKNCLPNKNVCVSVTLSVTSHSYLGTYVLTPYVCSDTLSRHWNQLRWSWRGVAHAAAVKTRLDLKVCSKHSTTHSATRLQRNRHRHRTSIHHSLHIYQTARHDTQFHWINYVLYIRNSYLLGFRSSLQFTIAVSRAKYATASTVNCGPSTPN